MDKSELITLLSEIALFNGLLCADIISYQELNEHEVFVRHSDHQYTTVGKLLFDEAGFSRTFYTE